MTKQADFRTSRGPVSNRLAVTAGVLLSVVAARCSESQRQPEADVDGAMTPSEYIANETGPLWTSETAWRLQEDLRLGTAEPGGPASEQFGHVIDVATGPNGLIYVLDGMAQQISVFDVDGAFRHPIGRRGAGPGEITFAVEMDPGRGDTLWLSDDGAARYSGFAPDGSFLGTHPRRIIGHARTARLRAVYDGYIDWVPVFPDGRFGARVLYVPIRLTGDFRIADSLPPITHEWRMLRTRRMPEITFDGLVLATEASGDILFAHAQEYRIYRRSPAGDTLGSFGLPAPGRPLDDRAREYVRATFGKRPSLLREYQDALPETMPIVRLILSDSAGRVFVFADIDGEIPGTVVDVFRPDGAYLGRMLLPTPVSFHPPDRAPVARVTSTHLYVVVRDRLDVPYVSRLEIVRPEPR